MTLENKSLTINSESITEIGPGGRTHASLRWPPELRLVQEFLLKPDFRHPIQ
jgi:hypothetical protein